MPDKFSLCPALGFSIAALFFSPALITAIVVAVVVVVAVGS